MPSKEAAESKKGDSTDQGKAFRHDPDADVIIRSSDSVDFRVRRTILAEVSAFFKQMFSLPQEESRITHDSSSNGVQGAAELPVIPVAEDEKALSLFLRCVSRLTNQLSYSQSVGLTVPMYRARLCYPNANHSLSGLTEIRSALQILRKYDVQRIPDAVGLALMFAVDEAPIKVYAIACGYNFPAIANAAAKVTLRRPILAGAAFISMEVLNLMTASQFNDLVQYHVSASRAASEVAVSWDWFEDPEDVHLPVRPSDACTCPYIEIDAAEWIDKVKKWVIQYQKEISDALKSTPDWDTATRDGKALARAAAAAGRSGCVHLDCSAEVEVENLLQFHAELRDEVVSAISSVSYFHRYLYDEMLLFIVYRLLCRYRCHFRTVLNSQKFKL